MRLTSLCLLGFLAVTVPALAVEQRGNGVPLPKTPSHAAAPKPATPPAATPPPGGYPATVVPPKEETALVLDSSFKEYTAKPGEQSATFTFKLTNTAREPIVVTQVRTSCGCSVAKLPADPWMLRAGEAGEFQIVVDLRGKRGVLKKDATIDTLRGFKRIDFSITIPEPDPRDEMRQRNLLIAQNDRQAVFKGDCARCHAEPTKALVGKELFTAACAICHADDSHRASMVPDLRTLSPQPTADGWRSLITHGKPGTLMPAFSASEGGPLTPEQIESLVEYLTHQFAAGAQK